MTPRALRSRLGRFIEPRHLRAVGAGVLLAVAASAAAQGEPTQIRRLLVLLRGIEQEYREAFDAGGVLVRPLELEEASLLLAEASASAATLANQGQGAVAAQIAALDDEVKARVAVAAVAARIRQIRTDLESDSGIDEEMLPARMPSAARGAALFRQNCISCHGEHGAGDGPEVPRLKRRPADFTDELFMRDETPADFFLVISLGRRSASMPAWEEALSVQERWDLVAYVWGLRGDAANVAAGAEVFAKRCGACHRADAAANSMPFADQERSAAISDADMVAALATDIRGCDAAALRSVAAGERENLAAYLRSQSLGAPLSGAVGAAAPDETARLERALTRVEDKVAAAVGAYRLRDREASDLAARAYLAFEPLEPAIARRDAAAVARVENEFVRLQRALHKDDASNEVEESAASLARALAATRRDLRSSSGGLWTAAILGLAAAAVAALIVVSRRLEGGATRRRGRS